MIYGCIYHLSVASHSLFNQSLLVIIRPSFSCRQCCDDPNLHRPVMTSSCVFCESVFADPILPVNRQKICSIFDVSFNGKKLLHESRICTRCQVQVELIDNALKLKAEMNQCLQEKLSKATLLSSNGGGATVHTSGTQSFHW